MRELHKRWGQMRILLEYIKKRFLVNMKCCILVKLCVCYSVIYIFQSWAAGSHTRVSWSSGGYTECPGKRIRCVSQDSGAVTWSRRGKASAWLVGLQALAVSYGKYIIILEFYWSPLFILIEQELNLKVHFTFCNPNFAYTELKFILTWLPSKFHIGYTWIIWCVTGYISVW